MCTHLYANSSKAFARACRFLVGGVSSPVRSFRAVGGTPVFFEKGKGSRLWDVDGNAYSDFCLSWGALVLGHADPEVTRAIARQAAKGTSFGACIPIEAELARQIRAFFPSCQKLRFTSSGTEAVMTAVRLARGATGRNRVIKFEGCYHGHSDALLVPAPAKGGSASGGKGGSGLAMLGAPSSAGVPSGAAADTLVLPFNAASPVEAVFKKFSDIAAVIVEPVAGNMGMIPGDAAFLGALRRLTACHGALLIFDEVITGFRTALGGVQARSRIRPDLTTLGKVIGGGLPVGAVGGRAAIMDRLAPLGPVYQAGTLSGNPLSMRAGLETLRILSRKGVFESLRKKTGDFAAALEAAFRRSGIEACVPREGSVFSIFFEPRPPRQFADISPGHVKTYRLFFRHLLERGVYLAPSAYEALFVSTRHGPRDFDAVLKAVRSFRPRPF